MRHTKVRVYYTSPIRPLPLPFSPPSTLPPLHSVPAPLPSLLQSGPQTQLWDLGERYELPQRYILEPKSRVWWRLKNPIRRLDSVPTVPPPLGIFVRSVRGAMTPLIRRRERRKANGTLRFYRAIMLPASKMIPAALQCRRNSVPRLSPDLQHTGVNK